MSHLPCMHIKVAMPCAHSFSLPPLMAKACSSQMVSVLPLLIAGGAHFLAVGGRQQVDLEFHREDGTVGGEQRKSGVTAGGIGDGRDHAGVKEAMLLRKLVPERQLDLAQARFDPGQRGADMRHDALAGEAVADAVGKLPLFGAAEFGADLYEQVDERCGGDRLFRVL